MFNLPHSGMPGVVFPAVPHRPRPPCWRCCTNFVPLNACPCRIWSTSNSGNWSNCFPRQPCRSLLWAGLAGGGLHSRPTRHHGTMAASASLVPGPSAGSRRAIARGRTPGRTWLRGQRHHLRFQRPAGDHPKNRAIPILLAMPHAPRPGMAGTGSGCHLDGNPAG